MDDTRKGGRHLVQYFWHAVVEVIRCELNRVVVMQKQTGFHSIRLSSCRLVIYEGCGRLRRRIRSGKIKKIR